MVRVEPRRGANPLMVRDSYSVGRSPHSLASFGPHEVEVPFLEL